MADKQPVPFNRDRTEYKSTYQDFNECGWPMCGCNPQDKCDDYHSTGTNCDECGEDFVQVQNGMWVCPSCDLWL